MSKYSETRRVQKNLPYTITPIADIAAWRVEQMRFEEQWQLKKDLKRQMVIQNMENGSLLAKEFGKSKTTQVHEKYQKLEADKKSVHLSIQKQPLCIPKQPQPSLFSRIINRLTDWFLSIKF